MGRLETIRNDFADGGLTDELLAEIVEAWVKVGEIDKAKEALAELREKFPKSDEVEDAEEAIGSAKVTTSTAA